VLGWVPTRCRGLRERSQPLWVAADGSGAPPLCCAAVSVRAATVAGKGDPAPLGFLLMVRLHSAASSSARPGAHTIPGTPQESPSVHRLFESSQISPRFAPQNWPPHVGGIKAGIEISPDKEIPCPKKSNAGNVGEGGLDSHFLP